MYLWVVLATFLAMIAGYYLPLRQDTPDLVNVPVAQARVAKMSAQHKLSLKYVRGLRTKKCYGPGPSRTDPDAESSCAEGETLVSNYWEGIENLIQPFADENNVHQITENEFLNYDSFGFKPDADYLTYIICSTSDCNPTDAAPETKPTRYLVTTGPVPEKWQRAFGDKITPTAEFMNALRAQFGRDEKVGYLENGQIINYEGTVIEIPTEISSTIEEQDGNIMYMTGL